MTNLEELHFPDPAFRCEVILSGAAKVLYETAKPQFERLKNLKSLGLVANIRDTAIHNRHQHAIGMMRIFNKLCQQPKKKGLPKEFLWSFWSRLCFGQTGHAALGYESEKAVLLACHVDSAFKEQLRELFQPVISRIKPCEKCGYKKCPHYRSSLTDGNEWFEDLIQNNKWRRLHLWITALKLVQDPKILSILNGQKIGEKNELGFSEPESIKMMIAPNCMYNLAHENLTRLDSVVRDLTFAGTLGITLDSDNLISSANVDHQDWELLKMLNQYLTDTLYETVEAQTHSILFQRTLAKFLINHKISLNQIFGFDLNDCYDDDSLKRAICSIKAGRDLFETGVYESWTTWPIHTYVDPNRMPSDIEKEIIGPTKKILTHHNSLKATCLKFEEKNTLALSIRHRSLVDRPDAKTFVTLCQSLQSKQYPNLIPDHLINALFEGLIDRNCENSLSDAICRLAKIEVSDTTLKNAAEYVNRISSSGSSSSGPGAVCIRIGEFDYPAQGSQYNTIINVMHAAIHGDKKVREILGLELETASKILWNQLFEWQSTFFCRRTDTKIISLINEIQDKLAKNVILRVGESQKDLELYTFLEALKQPTDSTTFRIVLPNLKLKKDDGNDENEYDVVSIILKNNKDVEVWVWGVTIEQNIDEKRTSDILKIQKLKDLLGNRWGEDIRVVICYVHKDKNTIVCDIDGRQDRRNII
jgi:hypothetical protein